MFLLDTNVVSELRRPSKAHPEVLAWARTHAVTQFYLSAISILELRIGVLRLARRDPTQAEPLKRWLEDGVLRTFAGRLLAVDTEVALRCADMHVPDPRADRDALIASTALVHGLTVVTRNEKDFEPLGVPVINPWVSRD